MASPTFTGSPTAPTAVAGTNSTQIATTAFVNDAIAGFGAGDMAKSTYDTDNDGKVDAAEIADAVPWSGITGKPTSFTPSSHSHSIAQITGLQTALDAKAPLASPALTGSPTAPTATAGTNTTQIATTAFVAAAIGALIDAAPGAMDTLNELAAALGDDPSFATTVTNALAGKLSSASNLSDLPNKATSRSNLGLGSMATQASSNVAITGGLADAEHFLMQLDGWITDAPEKIELWGGEPFLYWAKIKRLIPALAERFPAARFSIITNGSLLDREKLDFIAQYDITIGISHDGPGQHLRGPDPLDDPDKRRWIEALLAERPDKTGFNAVLTRQHHDLCELKAWFAEKVGPDIFVGLEGVVNVYDAATAVGTGRFEPADLNSLTRSIFEALVEDPNAFGLGERINEFYASIQRRRPIEALGQKCGMDSTDAIAVDLRGNVMTCQNTGAKGSHKIGHVAEFDAIALDTATHFAFREECMSCPVVQLCKGSCMFLEGDFFKQSCANEFAFNMGILMAAVWHLTGMLVVGVNAIDNEN